MSRALRVLPARDAREVQDALAEALSATGRALLPVAVDAPAPSPGVPPTVSSEVALVVRTSGSTGESKLVALSSAAVRASSVAAAARLGGPAQWLLALPAHYIAGVNVLARSIESNTQPVVLEPGPFDVAAFARAAEKLTHERRCTSLVPVQLGRLLDVERGIEALRSFTRVLVGGQATPRALLEGARDAGVNLVRTYGSSETGGGCVYDGVPLEATRVRIERTEVLLAGPTLALGYLDDAATERAFIHRDGERWFRTGDTGDLVDGVLTVTGRLDDQIISGGVNVALGAVENSVRSIAGLADAVVVARESEQWGAVPVVVSTAPADLATVRAHVASELGRASAPQEIVLVEWVPLLPSGKPDRLALTRLVAH